MVSSSKLKWRSDFDKAVLIQNFEKRGWIKASGEGKSYFYMDSILKLSNAFFSFEIYLDDWNIYWANPWTVK